MKTDSLVVAFMVVLVGWVTLKWRAPVHVQSPEWRLILSDLRRECDPQNPGADYDWSQSSQPTERRRDQILQRCRERGVSLLPEIKTSMVNEDDDQVQSMLIIIAASLGDEESLEKAARRMVWDEHPAVRITAARALLRLNNHRTIPWFRLALEDDYFVVNGGCGLLREKFYPVRSFAETALVRMAGLAETDAQLIERMRERVRRAIKAPEVKSGS